MHEFQLGLVLLIVRRSDGIMHRFKDDGFKGAKLRFDVFNADAKGGGGVPAHIGECRGAGGITALFPIGHVLVNPAFHKFNRPVAHAAILQENPEGVLI